MTSKPDDRELGPTEPMQYGDYAEHTRINGEKVKYPIEDYQWGNPASDWGCAVCKVYRPSRPECTCKLDDRGDEMDDHDCPYHNPQHGQAEKSCGDPGCSYEVLCDKYFALLSIAERMEEVMERNGLTSENCAALAAFSEWKRGNHA